MPANSLSTSVTLLQRLRKTNQPVAWERFAHLYTPLLLEWTHRQGFRDADAADLIQNVFLKLVSELRKYEPGAGQSFRGWLHRVLANEGHDFRRRRATRPLQTLDGAAAAFADPQTPPFVEFEETEYRRAVVRRGLNLIRPEFGETAWAAFEKLMLHNRTAAEIATELGITANAVYLARHRVLIRLREEIDGFLE
ncbi:MAG: sigma-70 family RNA polymerase sigma factor [Planctomycetes bacterium]|nr:sigma-70 family RNA polymerase sigma factor [Planctomycetota bacterium]